MSQITENTIVIDDDIQYDNLKEFVKNNRYINSLKVIYHDDNSRKMLCTFDCNGSPTEYDDWKIYNYLIETDYGDNEGLWTRNATMDFSISIQERLQNGMLFPQLHDNEELLTNILKNLEYNIGGLHGEKLVNIKPLVKHNNILNLNEDDKRLLYDSLNRFDDGEVFDYPSINDMIDDFKDGVIHLAYTTYGDNDDHEIQINFNLNNMQYEEYIDDKLIVLPNVVYKRSFYNFCDEVRNCSFDEMISTCAREVERVEEELKYENLKSLVGDKEFDKAQMYLNLTKKSIDDIYDGSSDIKGYDSEQINTYFKNNAMPTNEQWIEHLIDINSDLSNTQAFIDSLNRQKDGKDYQNTNYLNKSKGTR